MTSPNADYFKKETKEQAFQRGWKVGFAYAKSLVKKYRPSGYATHNQAIDCAILGMIAMMETNQQNLTDEDRKNGL